MAVEVDFQPIVDKYASALEAPRYLFDWWPAPRKQGHPSHKQRALMAAILLGVIGAFEGFAEDLVAASLLRRNYGWAHIVRNSDLTNPSLKDLSQKLSSAAGIAIAGPTGWKMPYKKQRNLAWKASTIVWGDALDLSDSWIAVRHCLSHGAVNGLGEELWPGPVVKGSLAKAAGAPSANDADVLAIVNPSRGTRALNLWPTINCARLFSEGAAVIVEQVAAEFGESVDTAGLRHFESV